MLRLYKIHTEEKKIHTMKKISRLSYKKSTQKEFFYFSEKINFSNFFLWFVTYECCIFYVNKKYKPKLYKIEELNYIIKRISIYFKAFESFFINTLIKRKEGQNFCDNNLLTYNLVNIFKISKNHLKFFRAYYLLKKINLNGYKSKLKYSTEIDIQMNPNKKYSIEYKKIKDKKNKLFNQDLQIINSYLDEKVIKANTLLNYKLIEQKNLIEQIHDQTSAINIVFLVTKKKLESKKTKLNKNKKINFVILLCWICTILCKLLFK
jgi:hypothetical protein